MDSVGAILRETREEKNLTLDDASRTTKIKKQLLEALENDDYGKLASPTYVKGFLKIYASYLGLDQEEVLREYLKDHTGDSEQVLVLDVEGTVKSSGRDSRLIGYAIIGAVAIFIAVGIFLIVRGLRRTRRAPAALPQLEMLEPSTVSINETELLEPAPPAPAREMELRIKAKKDVWVKVIADGVTVFQNVVRKGAEEFWKGKNGFTMRVGRPEAVILTLNGEPITLSGKTSKPRTIEIDGEGNVKISN